MDLPTYEIPNDVAKTTGPLIIGYLLGWGFFGVLSMQVYIYHLAYQREPLLRRAIVYGIYLLMLVQTILLTLTAFRTFGTGYGNLKVADDIHEIWFSIPVLTSIVAFCVQGYYARHIYDMSKDLRVALVIGLLAITQLAGGILLGVIQHGALKFSNFQHRDVTIATTIWNGAGTLCDLIIMAYMSYYFLNSKSPYRLKSAEIPIILRLVIQSGAFLAAISITNTVLSLLPHKHTYFQTSSTVLGNTYANTLMALFNNRVRIFRPSRYLYNDVSEVNWEERVEDPRAPARTQLTFATPSVLQRDEEDAVEEMGPEITGADVEARLDSDGQSTTPSEKVESKDHHHSPTV